MNTKQTWLLLVAALLLGGYIYMFEWNPPPPAASGPALLLPQLRPTQVNRVELVVSNLTLRAEQTNETWTLASPVVYPAYKLGIAALLEECRRLAPKLTISAREIKEQPRGLADFGLEPPVVTIKIQQGAERFELRVGTNTPVGHLLYLQVADSRDVVAVDADFYRFLPRFVDDWRDRALINLAGVSYNRLEMRPRTQGFEVQRSNNVWRMTWPIETRADNPKLNALVTELQRWPVAQFIADDPKVDLQAFGLQPPEAELAIGQGTNDVVVVQFGRSPTNAPGYVFARRLSHTNVVLVPRPLLDQIRVPHTEFRDRRLITFDPTQVDMIDVHAEENFQLRRETNQTWQVVNGTNTFLADPALVRNFLAGLGELDVVDFGNFVVTDFTTYGLQPPARTYSLKTTVTNTGAVTNPVLAQLEFGNIVPPERLKIYGRRADESAVYSLALSEVLRLPQAAYQLRDRRLWHFDRTNVTSVTSIFKGKASKIVRNAQGVWSMATPGIIVTDAVDEALHQLGAVRAVAWTDRGADKSGRFEISDSGHKLAIELMVDGKSQTVTVAFGGRAPGNFNTYAATLIEGQVVIFEFPQKVYDEFVLQYLTIP